MTTTYSKGHRDRFEVNPLAKTWRKTCLNSVSSSYSIRIIHVGARENRYCQSGSDVHPAENPIAEIETIG